MIDSQVERQIALEAQQISLGAQRYLRTAREEAGGGRPGHKLIMETLEPVAAAIDAYKLECASGRAARNSAAFPYLANVDSLEAAYLTARVALERASSRSTVTAAAMAISSTIEQHLQFCGMAKTDPGLYRKALQGLVRYGSTSARNQALKRLLERCAISRLKWSPEERILLGTKLMEIFQQVSQLIEIRVHREGSKRSQARVEVSEGCEEFLNADHNRMALLSPVYLPMVAPPRPWTGDPQSGGYLTDAVRSWMVRVRRREQLSAYAGGDQTMPQVLAALNAVQATPWRVNKAMLNVLHEASKMQSMEAVLPESNDEPMPPTPGWLTPDTSTRDLPPGQREEFLAWKAKRAKVHALNATAKAKRLTVLRKTAIADQFKDEEVLYLPYYLDFRGRMYPFCEALNPQGDDMTKSLLEFADGKPLGEEGAYWLAVNLANNFATGGIDKVPLDERVQWVLDHEREILDSALSPLDGQLFWHGAENPWQFLASCFEWAGYKVQGDSYVSHLPVNMDGSCSGLQHYSALLLDASGGAEVNLVPSSKPSDIYTAVAKRAQALVDSSVDAASAVWKNGKVIRKIVKQPTMTMCYAATQYGMRQQIEMALRKLDDGQEGSYLGAEENFQASVYLSKVVWESINATVVAARRGMDFLKGCATAMAAVHLPVDWQTPVGFLVSQMYSEAVGKKVEVHYNGARLMLTVRKEGDEVDGRAQAAGIAPNFVHSLDSAHLMATVLRGKSEGIDYWSVIHDSFGTHACNVGILNACLRDTFVEQYSVDRLTEFRDGLMEQLKARGESVELPEVPGKGTLDLEAVRRSEFFFA